MTQGYTIFNAARDLVTGKLELASKDVIKTRKDLCAGCEVQDKATRTCTACGCFLPAKVRLKESTCPMELW